MIKKILFLIAIFLLISINTYSQFEVNIKITKTDICKDNVRFIAKTTNGGTSVTDVDYEWDFDDGTQLSGTDLDTVYHMFTNGGGYIVRVKATKGANSDYALEKVQVSLTADFTGTKSNRPDPICLGQTVSLTGKANTVNWKYEIPDENIEENPTGVSKGVDYNSVFDNKYFQEADVVTGAGDIDTIGIKLEHTNLSNLQIKLTCAEGNSIILKDFGGQDKYFGEPIDDENSDVPGVGYYYYWTNSPDYGTINSSTTTNASLPAGSYTSEQAFSNLTGCSLNGKWTITVTDNQTTEKGFVFATRLKFNDSFLPADWTYENTYSGYIWDGTGITPTAADGTATGKPDTKGNSEYKLQVTDNFICHQDTSIFVNVEGASFTADPMEGPFDLEVNFTSGTSWATGFSWDFGDDTEPSTEQDPTHIFSYPDGKYTVVYTVTTDDDCSDTETAVINVTIPDPVFNEPPNVFTPNNDGSNDFFSLDVDDLAKLEGWIYSRWGKLVQEWKSPEEAKNGWNGKIQNSNRDAQPGVYYYYIKAVDYHGQDIIKKGTFQLFR
jgi:gliding motility-associated-like protein